MRVVVSLLVLTTALFAQNPEARFHALIPLGAEAYDVQGQDWKGVMTLLASAESPGFEGISRRSVDSRDILFLPDGRRLERYPSKISFRLTASYRSRFAETSPFPIAAEGQQNDYLLNLKFRIVVFDGLRQSIVQPEAVEMIGVPGELSYDERIYRVSVDLAKVPLRDRVVFEVHDANGGRICKFHLDLY